MINGGCLDILSRDLQTFDIVDGKKFCIKRDPSYNFLTIQKPTNITEKQNEIDPVTK
jgi:hypothetical protein